MVNWNTAFNGIFKNARPETIIGLENCLKILGGNPPMQMYHEQNPISGNPMFSGAANTHTYYYAISFTIGGVQVVPSQVIGDMEEVQFIDLIGVAAFSMIAAVPWFQVTNKVQFNNVTEHDFHFNYISCGAPSLISTGTFKFSGFKFAF